MTTDPFPALGVLGTGYWGRNLLRNFAALGHLAAFADRSDDAVAEHAAAYLGVRATTDIAGLLADPALDAIAIATPAATHGELVDRALDAGKHVFVEKPLCLDPREGAALKAKADRLGRVLMVGHLLLYHPAFEALQKTVAEGRVGTLRYIYSNRASLGKIRREENALWSFAPHDVSMILRLADGLPERVSAHGGAWLAPPVADTTLTHMQFSEGLQAHIFVSWMHPYKDHKLVVTGSDGMIVFDDTREGAEKLVLYAHRIGWNGDLPSVEKAEFDPVPYDGEEPLRRECRHFLDRLRDGARPRSDADEGLRVLTVLDACQRALTSGAPVPIVTETAS